MTPFDIGLICIAVLVVLVLAGLYVPIALIATSFCGVWAIKGSPILAGKMLGLAVNDSIASYYFGIIPLFVLMGFLVAESDLGQDAYDVANAVLGRLTGGLAMGTVGANAIFAAITGISIASAAVFTRVAVPEMVRHGYTRRFAVGVVAGSSVLGMLIPPSLLLILYAVLTEQSVGDLFLAGIVPGLLLATIFCLLIMAMIILRPSFTGKHDHSATKKETALSIARKAFPILLLIVCVLGGIYGGVFTPVEAGAIGCVGAFILGLAKRKLTLRRLRVVLLETGIITATICFLIIAAQMYSRMLAFSQVPQEFGALIAGSDMGFLPVLLLYLLAVILLGMILDSSSIMLIMVPIMLPILAQLNVDLIWFGILTVVAVEMGLLTPPFGISVFVIKATLNDPSVGLGEIFAGAFPFALSMLIAVGLLIAFPGIATGILTLSP
ncbi:TRAP C4-dicarboxylate transport system permease DctM [Nitratireductor indicus C115]|uniref:TRAP transporter large permease protein n=1 Tax=Nitratireductor indicus C115 TaxID=1231190 RepID=K2N4K9_9HYPH|nr:TRAP transporter large permease [Nitratireductor indicus]EKF42328.1 TRAP C4-dicarboxylate transport system permease DctM [Nitratireductor indicus C115]SFQ59565.1 TRAP transporter, DctM subunit [Nitratireductor indicus]